MMKRTGLMRGATVAVLVCLTAAAAVYSHHRGAWARPAETMEVVCTTTHLSTIVEAVGDGNFRPETVIPFGMCPGHFDLSPVQARTLLESPLVLHHGYERFLDGIQPENDGNRIRVAVQGNWMIPEVQIEGARAVREVLGDIRPGLDDIFAARTETYVTAVASAGDSLKALLSPYRGTKVLSAAMNRDFVEWADLQVLADFPRDEDMSIQKMHTLITDGRENGVSLVIDNRQSSGKVGRTIADELGVPLVILTNFPDPGDAAVYPYLGALRENCSLLLRALENSETVVSDGAL